MGWTTTKAGGVSDLVKRSMDAVDPALEMMAEDGGQALVDRVQENTPIGKEQQPLRGQAAPPVPGTLRDSIQQRPVRRIEGGFESGAFTDVLYAPYVEEGTGLFGPRHAKYKIEPKTPDGVLAFFARARSPEGKPILDTHYNPAEGGVVFAKYVMHPGSPGQHMFAIGATFVEAEFENLMDRGAQEWKRLSES